MTGTGMGMGDAEASDAARTRRAALERERGLPRAEAGAVGVTGPNPEPEDSGTTTEAWARLRSILVFRMGRSQLLAGALCALLGFAFVAQIQHTEASGLSALSEPELIRILDDVDNRNERLEAEAAQLNDDEEALRSGSNQREAARQQAEDRAEAMSILAGTVPVTGPGIRMSIAGSRGAVTAANVVTLVQELRDAGAEAIEINGVRIVVDSYFTEDSRGGLEINGSPAALPLRISAIGEPETLSTALRIPGGLEGTIEQRGGRVEIEQLDSLDIDSVVPGLGG